MRPGLMFFRGNRGNSGNISVNLLKAAHLLLGSLFPLAFSAVGTLGTNRCFVPSVPTWIFSSGNNFKVRKHTVFQSVRRFVPTVPSVPIEKGHHCAHGSKIPAQIQQPLSRFGEMS
jgi:hypothetical protein